MACTPRNAGMLYASAPMATRPTSHDPLPNDFLASPDRPAHAVLVEDLELSHVQQGWGDAKKARSCEGKPITLGGVVYPHGVGSHSPSEIVIELARRATRFVALAGIDDETNGQGSARFEVWLDDRLAADSGERIGGQNPHLFDVDLRGVRLLRLVVAVAGHGIHMAHADWAGAMLFHAPGVKLTPRTLGMGRRLDDQKIARSSRPPPKPAIHGPRIVGTTPGRPFLFLVPATGAAPLRYEAAGLPEGLAIDPATGIISGSVARSGKTVVRLTVKGPRGRAIRELAIVAGKNKLARTPPLGWNSWNCWAQAVDDAKIRQSADWLVKSGLSAHGFAYVNIDDCWEGERDETGRIQTNEKFPDMNKLAQYVHAKGLKLGIYSSPGPKTCAGYEGSLGHEPSDAETYAEWGCDYLKYDWCSYGPVAEKRSTAYARKPYEVMQRALAEVDRDIVYSLCQYGMADVWKWGAKVGGQLWRTTGDITDSWGSMAGIGFSQDGLEKYAGPGHFNDPDMLVIGQVGWGPKLHRTRLHRNEQITHMTLWAILAAPLLIGCDLAARDEFTLDLLMNDDVLDINQDPLGRQGRRIEKNDSTEIWARDLCDGTRAVGLFNRGREHAKVTVLWRTLGLRGAQPVRDLWLRKNVGVHARGYTATVPVHGAIFVRVGTTSRS